MRKPTSLVAFLGIAGSAALAAALAACSEDGPGEDELLSDAARRGKQVYINCIACHGADPTRDGPVGPAIAGASRELIEARVLRGEYPSGYSPKRDTAQMPPMPYLAPRIDDLAAYLREVAEARAQASRKRASRR